MCQQLFQSLFGGGQQNAVTPTPAAAPAPVATAATRDKRNGGQVKVTTPDAAPSTSTPSAGNISIGGAIGQADGVRKRTTELGL